MRRLTVSFTAIFLFLLVIDLFPGLRGGSGWRWPYALPENALRLLPLMASLLIYLTVTWYLRRKPPQTWLSLLWVIFSSVVITLSVINVRGDVGFLLFTRTVSPVQTGASALAVRYFPEDGVEATLENWLDVMADARDANLIHFTTSPPGQPLLHHWTSHIFDNPVGHEISMLLRPYQCSNVDVMRYTSGEIAGTLIGLLMPVWAALGAIPLYGAATALLDDRRKALQITQWWPLIPTIALFSPTWNTVYPTLCVTVFALLLIGLKQRGFSSILFVMLAGTVMSFTTFLNFAVLPLLLLFGLFVLGCRWMQSHNVSQTLRSSVFTGFWFGLGLLSIWIVFCVVSGLKPFDLLRVTFTEHNDLVQRDYLPWLLLHPYDTLLFIGWPVAAMFIWMSYKLFRDKAWSSPQPITILTMATLTTFVVLNVSGIVQGENGRILSFYAPFLLLVGGGLLDQSKTHWDVPLLAAQASMVLVMAAALPVIPLDLNPQPDAPRTDMQLLNSIELIPNHATFSSADYDGTFILESHRFVADVGQQVITLETVWRGGEQVERPYQFEVIARAENAVDGEIVTEPHRWYAQSGHYLPTCWRDDDIIHDITMISLPVISAPVIWTLELRAVDARTGDIMEVKQNDQTTDHATLAPVNYP